ncbi:hypothetical protein JI735_00835 [Paenibacillus sonchi]|uniref:DUF5668 domain-containing protein n=3 Tax=Paenibacillus sonchi group TaxID=2044880 RepID=A0A974SEG1_9BACL|nr:MULTISPECIES: hypothetical protein [Paenibacillus sonchi group]KWX75733.1 hypothetical protein AMQ84_17165 [Paenibacillus riograndensis]MCE3202577.1 hypothetical protein [Paenibacillus sonchi]QQZ61375.1 hypothetical protein JI735_00835 [Paenibacillus sonchi]CQR57558.1 hypothetical protein PRIO_5159 [Paenibacillus riograndensis SBR5]
MSSKNDAKLGIFILAAGIVILFGKLGVFGFLGRALWPLVILVPGLFLHVLFFSRRAPASVLLPAGILTVYGLLLGLCNTWGWGLMSHLWPLLLLGIAVGLYEYSLYSPGRNGGLTTTAVILGLLSVVLLVFSMLGTGALYVLGAILIAAGAWLIFGRGKPGGRKKWNGGW